jgi:tetratricopeptide (TPR) repeat protein
VAQEKKMKINVIFTFLTGLLFFNSFAFSADTYKTNYFEGSAPIVIDGDVSDWDALSLPSSQFIFDDSNSPEHPVDSADFTGSFMCCADINYLYIAVIIKDESVIHGEERLGKAFHDDSILIHFPNGRNDYSRSTLAISLDSQDKTIMEYYEHPVDQRYPFIWEAFGAKSNYKITNDGYIIETAIPHKSLNIINLENTLTAKLNVEVFDDDNGGERDSAFLLDYRGWWYPDWYYTTILFDKTQSIAEIPAVQNQSETNSENVIEAIVGSPDNMANQDIIYSIFDDTTNEEWDLAEEKLIAAGDFPWVKPMLAWVQLQGNNYDSAIKTFSEIINTNSDDSVTLWARYYLAYTYLSKRDYSTASSLYNNLLSSAKFELYENSLNDLVICEENMKGFKSAKLVFERELGKASPHPLTKLDYGRFLSRNGKNTEAISVYENMISNTEDQEYRFHALRELSNLYVQIGDKEKANSKVRDIIKKRFGEKIEIAKAFELTEDYDEAIKIYETIIKLNENKYEVLNAQLGITRNYFYKGDNVTATQMANKLITSNPDSKIAFEAQMIIASIERQQIK